MGKAMELVSLDTKIEFRAKPDRGMTADLDW